MGCAHVFEATGELREEVCEPGHKCVRRPLFYCLLCGREGTAQDIRAGKLTSPEDTENIYARVR